MSVSFKSSLGLSTNDELTTQSQSHSHYQNIHHHHESRFQSNVNKNYESLLILERSLERTGQQWVENLNVIEQHLVDIVEIMSEEQPLLKSNFILRRLPMYTVSSGL